MQAQYKGKDQNSCYVLNKKNKEDYTDLSFYTPAKLIHTNKLLEKFSECTYYKASNDKLYKIYKYYFSGEVKINDVTGLVDEVIFTCIDNSTNYENAYGKLGKDEI